MDEDLKILSAEEVKKTLIDYPGWEYRDDKITREFQFESFGEAVEFIKKLAPFCDKIDHHPDVHIYYKKVVFDLQRFSVGGKVTQRDFRVALEIERMFSSE